MKVYALILFMFHFGAFGANVSIGLATNFSEVSSGSSNPYGGYFKDGVLLAVEKEQKRLQEKNIVLNFKEFDYGVSDVRVLDAARKAIASDVVAVLGYNYSSNALLASKLHQEAKLPMLSPSASANRLGEIGPYIHLGSFDNNFIAKSLARIARRELKVSRAIIIPASNCAYCVDLANSFERDFQAQGGKVVDRIEILQEDKDFSKVVARIKQAQFDVVLIPNQELTSARIISALSQAGINKPLLGADGWGNVGKEFFSIIGNKKFEGYSVSHWHSDLKHQESLSFLKDYQKRFGKVPNDTSVLAYDSMRLLIQSILQAKSLSRDGIEDSLNAITHFTGITGKFLLKPNKAPLKSLVLLKAKESKFIVMKSISPEPGGK